MQVLGNSRRAQPKQQNTFAGERAPSLPESDALFYCQVWLSPRAVR